MPTFTTDNKRVLRVDLTGETIKAAQGSMVATDGKIDLKGAGMGGGQGLRAAFKQKVAGEPIPLMTATGHGTAYFADDAQEVNVIHLNGDTLSVESDHILTLTDGLRTDVKFTGLQGAMSGQGLATTTVTGNGTVAVTSHGPLIHLQVTPQAPVVVDPQAFVCSKGDVRSSIVSGVSWKMLVGESHGEAFSLRFEGNGIVSIQPAERF